MQIQTKTKYIKRQPILIACKLGVINETVIDHSIFLIEIHCRQFITIVHYTTRVVN